MARLYVSWEPHEPNNWRLERPYERDTTLGRIVVPEGFETDLASTPQRVWREFPRWGPWSGAAIIHDFLYRTKPSGVSRFEADVAFRELMRDDGVFWGTTDIFFKALRQWGHHAWSRHGQD